MTIHEIAFPPASADYPEIEPCNIADTFVEGISSIEAVGPCRRLKFMMIDRSGSKPVRVVVERLVMPAEALLDLARAILDSERASDLTAARAPSSATAH
jgi:hypothetical protein